MTSNGKKDKNNLDNVLVFFAYLSYKTAYFITDMYQLLVYESRRKRCQGPVHIVLKSNKGGISM